MKSNQVLIISNILAWVTILVVIAFYINSSSFSKEASSNKAIGNISIAYFSLDSIQKNYDYFLSLQRTMEAKQAAAQEQLVNIERQFQASIKSYEQKIPSMTQSQAEAEQKKIYALRQQFEEKKQSLQVKLIESQSNAIQKVQATIEEYIRNNQKDYPYDFVFANQPGLLFYQNPAFNITSKLIKDLNEAYQMK